MHKHLLSNYYECKKKFLKEFFKEFRKQTHMEITSCPHSFLRHPWTAHSSRSLQSTCQRGSQARPGQGAGCGRAALTELVGFPAGSGPAEGWFQPHKQPAGVRASVQVWEKPLQNGAPSRRGPRHAEHLLLWITVPPHSHPQDGGRSGPVSKAGIWMWDWALRSIPGCPCLRSSDVEERMATEWMLFEESWDVPGRCDSHPVLLEEEGIPWE